jgi:multimeric flavodoxin WrbA
MAPTLLGIVGSPRKSGNSELFVKELFGQLPSEWQLKLIRLPALDIRPCLACYQCLFGEMKCPQKDDFQLVLDSLIQADAYAVAVPTYFLGPNACLKRFLDRALSFYAHVDRLWGKPAVGVAIAGILEMEGYTKLCVDSFIKLTLGDLRGSEVIYGALPGEIFLENGGKQAASRLARALMGGNEPAASSVPVCPLCGGDTFRFMEDGKLRCMLCSSPGRYDCRENRLSIETHPTEHSFILSYEEAVKHAEWLRSMKEQFLARRQELKAVTQGYSEIGTWVKPEKTQERN